ncbi:hypothetical protein OG275_38205 (plasmid) [Streptomyces niveus]|uniref:hypothetical protein n=1 Tax=Streptomyces niveus TaxID=193462 RepID=UPI002E378460|nr:hypothetical protein [Streptomyces niveus]
MIAIMKDRRRLGPAKGTRFRPPTYDPATGETYRPGSNFEPDAAVKLLDMCERLDISVAGFLQRVVELMEVDPETGKPVGWPHDIQLKEAS